MSKEDLKLLPLAAIGLVIGIGEVIIKPFVMEESEKLRKIAAASIQYYSTFETPEDPPAV